MKILEEIKKIASHYQILCVCTLGLTMVGYALYKGRRLAWIQQYFGMLKKVRDVGIHHLKSPSTLNQSSKGEGAVLYMSITGNPTHLGHMSAVATAIDVLAKKGIMTQQAKISLSHESYYKSKVAKAGGHKKALSQEVREHILKETIAEASRRNMFQGVPVEYWDDQENGSSDHFESYCRLAAESQVPVYLVAGVDLCQRMGNWKHSVKNAVIIFRDNKSCKVDHLPASSSSVRFFAKSIYPEFESLSSSAIQEGRAQLEPAQLQDYFKNQNWLVSCSL